MNGLINIIPFFLNIFLTYSKPAEAQFWKDLDTESVMEIRKNLGKPTCHSKTNFIAAFSWSLLCGQTVCIFQQNWEQYHKEFRLCQEAKYLAESLKAEWSQLRHQTHINRMLYLKLLNMMSTILFLVRWETPCSGIETALQFGFQIRNAERLIRKLLGKAFV